MQNYNHKTKLIFHDQTNGFSYIIHNIYIYMYKYGRTMYNKSVFKGCQNRIDE